MDKKDYTKMLVQGSPRKDEAIITDFVRTTRWQDAELEIFKFLEANGVVFTIRQLKIFRALIVHYKNLKNSRSEKKVHERNDEIDRLKRILDKNNIPY